jgi:hypothetical protein
MDHSVAEARRQMNRLATRIVAAQSRLSADSPVEVVRAEVTAVQHEIEAFLFRFRHHMSSSATRNLVECVRRLDENLRGRVEARTTQSYQAH